MGVQFSRTLHIKFFTLETKDEVQSDQEEGRREQRFQRDYRVMSGAESEDTGDEEEASTSQRALTPTEASPHDSQDRTHRKS